MAAPPKARIPNPSNLSTGVTEFKVLHWYLGSGGTPATSHDIYFGTSSPPPPVHSQVDAAGQCAASATARFYNPGTLLFSTTYYWRIDEVNGDGTTTGDEWSFVTEAAGDAEFSGAPISGAAPLGVNFTDETPGVPTSWLWNFGVGTAEGTDTVQDPSHIYNTSGKYYDVNLKAYTEPVGGFYLGLAGGINSSDEIFSGPEYSGLADPYLQKVVWQTSKTLLWNADPTKVHPGDMVADPRGPGFPYIYFIRTDFGFTNEVYRVNTDGSGLLLLHTVPAGWNGNHLGWNWGSDGLIMWPAGIFGEYVSYMDSTPGGLITRWRPFIENDGMGNPYPLSACCTFSDGRFAGWSSAGSWAWRRLRLWNIIGGFIIQELDPGWAFADNWGWGAEDNSQNCFYFTDSGGGHTIGRWDIGPNTAVQVAQPGSVAKPIVNPTASGDLIYFAQGTGSMRRYNHTTHTWAVWNGSVYKEETREHYIGVGVGGTIPEISLDTGSLSPSCYAEEDADTEYFDIENTGDTGSTLSYTISDDSGGWLVCVPDTGSVDEGDPPDSIAVSYNTAGLAAGSYSATITISDPVASNDPQTISVSLTISHPDTSFLMRGMKWFNNGIRHGFYLGNK